MRYVIDAGMALYRCRTLIMNQRRSASKVVAALRLALCIFDQEGLCKQALTQPDFGGPEGARLQNKATQVFVLCQFAELLGDVVGVDLQGVVAVAGAE